MTCLSKLKFAALLLADNTSPPPDTPRYADGGHHRRWISSGQGYVCPSSRCTATLTSRCGLPEASVQITLNRAALSPKRTWITSPHLGSCSIPLRSAPELLMSATCAVWENSCPEALLPETSTAKSAWTRGSRRFSIIDLSPEWVLENAPVSKRSACQCDCNSHGRNNPPSTPRTAAFDSVQTGGRARTVCGLEAGRANAACRCW